MQVTRMTIDCDLAESSIRHACSMMSVRVEEVTVFASSDYYGHLDKYDHLKCQFILVPKQLMGNENGWVAKCRDMAVWSSPPA